MRFILLLAVVCLVYSGTSRATWSSLQSSYVAQSGSGNAKLLLTTETLKETYCDGPDPDLLTLKMLLRVSFKNVGMERVILQRGGKLSSVIRVSKTAEDAIANRFETTINNSIITTSGTERVAPKKPSPSRFIILSPGETYNTITEVSIPVPRNKPLPPGVNPGTHYLQIGVWTWDESQSEAKLRRRLWQKEGFLWSESLFSKPMSFTVRLQPMAEDCNCQTARIDRLAAIEIANQRMKALGRPLKSHNTVAMDQKCEWQVVFEPKDRNSPASMFIIDKVDGKVLAEFQ